MAEAATSTALRPLVPLRVVGAAAEWLALDPALGLVVVERLHVSPDTEREFLDAVGARAEQLVGQRAPGLRPLLAIRRADGGLELVSEPSIAERLAVAAGRAWTEGQLELDVAASIGVAIAEALGALHARDMAHGPLTPHDVDVGADGRVELTAHVRRAAVVALRPGSVPVPVAYFAPELVQGRPPSPASDVFGLGILCWELMAGERLFAREDEGRTTARALSGRVPPLRDVRPDAPETLASLIARALDRSPDRRPSLDALRAGLAEHACDVEARGAWIERRIGDRLAAWAATGESARRGEAPDAPEPEGTALWPLDARVDAAPGGSERAASAPTWPAVAQGGRRAPRGERPASVGSPLSLPIGERVVETGPPAEARPTLPTGAGAARDTLPNPTRPAVRSGAARTEPTALPPPGIGAAVTIPAEAPPRPAARPRTPLPLSQPAPRVALPPLAPTAGADTGPGPEARAEAGPGPAGAARSGPAPQPRAPATPAPAPEPAPRSASPRAEPPPAAAPTEAPPATGPDAAEVTASSAPTEATRPEASVAAATATRAGAPERTRSPAPTEEGRSAPVELDARTLAGAPVATPPGRRAEPTQVVRIKGEARYVRPPEGETPEPEATEAREHTRQIRVSTLDPDDAMVVELQGDRRRRLLVALAVLGAVVVLLLVLVLRPPEKTAVSIAPHASPPPPAVAPPAAPGREAAEAEARTPEVPDRPEIPPTPEPPPVAEASPTPPPAPAPTPEPPPPPAPPATPEPPPPAAPPEAAVEQVTLRFEVEPADAEIRVEGRRLEQPRWTGPAGDAPLDVRVTAPGHRRKKLRVAPSEDRTIEVRLRRRAPSRRKSASPSDGLLFDGSDL